MSLDKAIEHGKEHRKQYKDLRRWFSSMRNHGADRTWRSDRLFRFRDKKPLINEDIEEELT